jgi:Flavodoxin-like fold
VLVSDLYQMKFDPVSDRRNFTTIANSLRFNQQKEERLVSSTAGFAPDQAAEIDKLLRCDLLILQFPIWWMGMLVATAVPAISGETANSVNGMPMVHAESVLRLRSSNSFDETVSRLKADVQAKGIRFFDSIDQTGLGATADLKIGHRLWCCSANRRLACSSCNRTDMPGSTGRLECWLSKKAMAASGSPGPILASSPSAMLSRTRGRS